MPALRVDSLRLPPPRRRPFHDWLWREWCFLRVVAQRFRLRALLLLLVLFGGAAIFVLFDAENDLAFDRATYYVWSLLFGQPPEAFPASSVLRVLYFLVPVLGLTVIIEAIVEFALLLRDRRHAEQSWCILMAQSLSNHVVLVGFGRLGYRTYRLLRRLGENLVVVERDAAGQFLDVLRRDHTPLILGDARRDQLLIDANVAHAKSIVVATDDDLANLEIALDARRINPDIRVVLRMFDQNLADKVRAGFNIQIAMSQSAMSAPAFAMAAMERSIVNSFVVGDELMVMRRWTASPRDPVCGKSVAQLLEDGIAVIELTQAGSAKRLLPPPATTIANGDEALLQGTFEKVGRLSA